MSKDGTRYGPSQPPRLLSVHLNTPGDTYWGQSYQSDTSPESHRVRVRECIALPAEKPVWSGLSRSRPRQTFPSMHWSASEIQRLGEKHPPPPAFRSRMVLPPFFFFPFSFECLREIGVRFSGLWNVRGFLWDRSFEWFYSALGLIIVKFKAFVIFNELLALCYSMIHC